MPGTAARTFVQTKEPELKNAFDDWLARIVCFAFSVSPQALVSQMNRATAQVQKALSEEEGLAPVDPKSISLSKGIAMQSVLAADGFDVIVAGPETLMDESFTIGWSNWKFTYEPEIVS